MTRAPEVRRAVWVLLAVAALGLVLVLGLWQEVVAGCGIDASDADPLAACDPADGGHEPGTVDG